MTDKTKMLKFVVSPDNYLIADIFNKIEAEGVLIEANKKSIIAAIEEGRFFEAFGDDIKIADDMVQKIEESLKKQIAGMISLANKSGSLICGFDKIKSKSTKIEFIISAKDGSKAGKDKIKTNNVRQFEVFSIDELDRILAKENTVHIALLKGKIATNLLKLIESLDFFEN